MRNIAIIDEAFDSNVASDYHLSVQYSGHCCTFAILDTLQTRYIAFKSIWAGKPVPFDNQEDHIRHLLQSESYVSLPFKSVHFMYLSPLSVLVPASLFREDHPELYLKFSTHLTSSDQVHFRKIPEIDAYTVFTIPAGVANRVAGIIDGVKLFHQSSPFISSNLCNSKLHNNQNLVAAHVHPDFVDILVLQSGQVVLYNSFKIRNTTDLIFFILYMFDQFSLSQDDCPVVFSGFTELFPGTADLLYKYLKNIAFGELPKNWSYCKGFEGLSPHHYLQVINLARCE